MTTTIAKFAAALGEVQTIVRDQVADTGKYTYNYADINSILAMLKPILRSNSLALSQPLVIRDGNLCVDVMLVDLEPENPEQATLTFHGPGFPVKGDPQAAGGAITYFRRYHLVSLFSLEAADDDGAAAAVQHATPDERTPAEKEMRAGIAALDRAARGQFVRDFRGEFGVGLTDLPTERHGDALTYFKSWTFDADRYAQDAADAAADGAGY